MPEMNQQDVSFEEKYQSLPTDVKTIAELIAFSCCPISKHSLENAIYLTIRNKTEVRKAISEFKNYPDIISCGGASWDSYYLLEPTFSLQLLIHLNNLGRDLRDEIKDFVLWANINRLGLAVREALLNFYLKKKPFDYFSVIDKNLAAPSLIYATLHLEEFTGIEAYFPALELTSAFHEMVTEETFHLKSPAPIDKLYQRLRAVNTDDRIYQKYLTGLHDIPNSLFRGKFDELAAADTDAAEGYYAKGVYHLYKGDYKLSIKHFEAGIKVTKLVLPDTPFYSYAYAMALVLDNSESSMKRILTLSKKKLLHEYVEFLPLRLLFALKQEVSQDVLKGMLIEQNTASQYPFLRILVAGILRHHQLEFKQLCTDEHLYVSQLEKNGWDLLLLETSSTYPELQEIYHSLQKKLGVTSLISRIEVVPEWEKTLNTLLRVESNESPEATKTTRIVYLLDKYAENIRPVLQQSKDGATWSAGRAIALKRLADASLAEMNDTDKEVARHIKQGYNYNGVTYYFDNPQAIACLAGYPLVFLDSNPQIPVEVVEEKTEIVIRQLEKGFTVTSNVSDPDYPVQINQETATRIKVTRLTKEQQRVLRILKRVTRFPLEAKDHLLRLIQHLNQSIVIHSDLVDESVPLKTVDASNRIIVQLLPIGDSLRAELFCKPFDTHPPYCKPGKGAKSITGTRDNERYIAIRDLAKEQENRDEVLQGVEFLSDDTDGDSYIFNEVESCLNLLESLKMQGELVAIEWPEGVRYRVRHHVSFDNLHISLTKSNQWFEVEGELRVGEDTILSIRELLEAEREAKGLFIPLGEGEYIALTRELKKRLDDLEAITLKEKNKLGIQPFASMFFDGWEDDGIDIVTDKAFKELRAKINSASALNVEVPPSLNAELREYQVAGFEWMARLAAWGAGGCLADDMGLGKTIQTIAMLLRVAPQGPSLVVCPASVLPNWGNELNRFAPSLNVYQLNASAERGKMIDLAGAGDVILATYGMLVTEEECLTGKTWRMIALDEAHTIKNRETKMSKSAMKLQADFRLILTGTPIQNHLGEIWNLFQFINPGLLGSLDHFAQRFVLPITQLHDKQRQAQLKRMLSPFLLRRTKSAVLDELPPKTEIVKEIELSEPEMACYELLRREAEESFQNASPGEQLKALAELTRLRLAACNVNLVNKTVKMESSKMEAFLDIILELQANNHRALVFSQFTSNLALVREALDARHISYLYLDGSTPIRKREELVRSFQTGTDLLFLVSLKAGGLGLNLTAADFVIHMDPWWNPAIEDQASDRAHRIGQARPVTVYRLIAKGTIEEKIIRLHRTKKDLADSLLEGADLAHKLTREEILELLRHA